MQQQSAAVSAAVPAFVLVPDPRVRWPVTVRVPADGGAFVEQGFTGVFRVLPEEALATLFPVRDEEEIKDRRWTDVLAENAKKLPEVLVDWDVKDPQGKPVPISCLAAALTGEHGKWLAAGIHQAIVQLRLGMPARAGATEGNSPTAPAPGSAAQSATTDPTSTPTT
ncbi:MAG: hypothetical protein ACK4KV_18985 [Rhodocyclaceae bacterium]